MFHRFILLFSGINALAYNANNIKDLETIHTWNLLEYEFPSPQDRQEAINRGNLVSDAGTLIDIQPNYEADGRRRIFATIPRFLPGIPFSLGVVSPRQGPNGPLIQPFPSYSWHTAHGSNCDNITSAFRIAIDECNMMWVIDSGAVGSMQYCPPQLLVFNLTCNSLVHRYRFPNNVYTPSASLFVSLIVDVRDPPPRGKCFNTMVYVADVNFHGLVVYDLRRGLSWRIENKLMYPNPEFGTHSVAGENFDLMDGIFGLSVDPLNKPGERYLYFHALASDSENAVALRELDDDTTWMNDPTAKPRSFKQIGKRGVQCGSEAMDKRGNLYCVTMDPLTLFGWNINSPYSKKSFKVLANNPQSLQFASGVKIVRNSLGHEELWISTCRYQKIATGTQKSTEINFRISTCKIEDLLDVSRRCGDIAVEQQYPLLSSPGGLHSNLIFQ